eukprot:gnl/TRDRNA2_/TRDRNA2_131139_c0_seq1.p2 gnl/TRDRNA2_/TRDRNA2_131139_c0~~gnl/TRDRNA2_/TRDRNA2_131139_c0_seq1.p2  ORF type:complete len:103 (+),score=16.03 gnl/TRDRNA2_/TRDRNA2_131139_c0_seq1:132-440(+)
MPIPDDNKMKATDYRAHIYAQITQRRRLQRGELFGDSKKAPKPVGNQRRGSKDSVSSMASEGGDVPEAPSQPWSREGGQVAPPTTPRYLLQMRKNQALRNAK